MDQTLVIVAAIGAGPMILGHWLTYKATREARDNAAKALTIVQGNGQGDVAVMLKSALTKLDVHGAKINEALKWQGTHEAEHTRYEAAQVLRDDKQEAREAQQVAREHHN